MCYIPAAIPESAQFFAHPHSQKPARFPAGQSEHFHPAKPSFYPPAVTAGITHYTLQAKPCAKGMPLWKPPVLSGSRCDPQNRGCTPSLQNASRRHRPARPPVLIYAACLPIWALTVSPILTVLIYYFYMDGGFAASKSLRGTPHRGVVRDDVFAQLDCPLFRISFHGQRLPP